MPAGRLIFAGVSGSPGSVQALRHAADLARQQDAFLVPVLAWTPPGGDRADRASPDPELRRLWTDDAWQRLRDALGTAFGGPPPGVCTWPLVVRGPAGQVLVNAANRTTDLLVIGAGRRGPRRLGGGRVSRYCLAQARCPVLAIPPAALAREAERGLRGWAFRHRRLDPAAYVRLSAPGSTRPPLRTGSAAKGAAKLRRIQSEHPRCPGGLLFMSSRAGQSHRAASQD